MHHTTESGGDYAALCLALRALTEDEPDALANLSNSAALLYHSLKDLNWAGFYLFKENQLVLGPFQGRPACVRIALGRGVCGSAALSLKTLVVPDVHAFLGHIACDGSSASELVIPLVRDGVLCGVMDIDSPVLARFSEQDRQGLEDFAAILTERLNWKSLLGL